MPFPKAPRVIYEKNPLDKVICQIKFPPILKIEAEIPAQFQDKIRGEFPDYTRAPIKQINIPPDIIKKIPKEAFKDFPKFIDTNNHEFTSEDGNWTVNLTSTFIAFSCTKYTRWEKFKEYFRSPFEIFFETYDPSYVSRLGLRYIDVIMRSTLGLDSAKWSELLKPHMLGLISSLDVEDRIDAFENKYGLMLDDDISKVKIMTGFVENMAEQEECFMIDSDFFNESKIPFDQVWNKLDYFNKRASRLIQWCITNKLHTAMEPRQV